MDAPPVSIDELLGLEPVRLADEQVLTSLEAVERTRRRVEAQRLALIAEVEQRGLALEQGATSTAAFVRARLGAGPRESARLVRLAADVAAEPAARTALATGEVSAEHAQVIVRTLAGLPASVPTDLRGRAEALLLEWARTFDAEAMSRLARRLQSRIADEWAARDERADAEDRAYVKRGLWLSEMGDGFVLRADLDHEVGAGLQAMIAACSRPRRTSDGERDPRSAPQRRADGLEHILRLASASGQLPEHGGQRPGLVVTTDVATLQRRPGAAQANFEDGAPLSVDLLRRLACDAEVIPAVLGSRGEPLDLG